MEEIWKVFVYQGFETKYYGSNLGNVGRIWKGKMKILKPSTNKYGYKSVCLWINGKQIQFLVHRLVALCFLPNPNNYEQVNHKDGKKYDELNNQASNLEWCNSQQNMNHAKEHGLTAKGEKNGSAKITEAIVIEIFRLYHVEKWFQRRIAKHFGISQQQVSDILNRICWGWLPIPAEYLTKNPIEINQLGLC
jgi:hypothetical protein